MQEPKWKTSPMCQAHFWLFSISVSGVHSFGFSPANLLSIHLISAYVWMYNLSFFWNIFEIFFLHAMMMDWISVIVCCAYFYNRKARNQTRPKNSNVDSNLHLQRNRLTLCIWVFAKITIRKNVSHKPNWKRFRSVVGSMNTVNASDMNNSWFE